MNLTSYARSRPSPPAAARCPCTSPPTSARHSAGRRSAPRATRRPGRPAGRPPPQVQSPESRSTTCRSDPSQGCRVARPLPRRPPGVLAYRNVLVKSALQSIIRRIRSIATSRSYSRRPSLRPILSRAGNGKQNRQKSAPATTRGHGKGRGFNEVCRCCCSLCACAPAVRKARETARRPGPCAEPLPVPRNGCPTRL